jgi:hypothetical protein
VDADLDEMLFRNDIVVLDPRLDTMSRHRHHEDISPAIVGLIREQVAMNQT